MSKPLPRVLLGALDCDRPLLLDGAMGTQLLSSGFDLRRDLRGQAQSVDVLNLTRPEQVQAVHESYLDAGSRALRTNTFLSSGPSLAERGLLAEGQRLIRSAVAAAREAAEAWCPPNLPGFVLGDIGPPAWSRGAEADPGLWEQAAREQAAWLAAAGVDGLLLETATDLEWLRAAVRGVRASAGHLPLLISAALTADGQLLRRGDLAGLSELAQRESVDLLGINCTPGPADAARLWLELCQLYPGRLGLWPSPSGPGGPPGRGPREFATALEPVLAHPRLCLLGACCGSGPAHIGALGERLGRGGALEPEQDQGLEFGD